MRHVYQACHGKTLIAVCALVFLSTPVKADVNTIRSSNSAVWGAVGGLFFNYKEPATSPDLPDSEHGWLPSVAGGVSDMTEKGWYFAVEASGAFGNARYNGASLFFPTMPLQGTTHETIATVDTKVGKGIALGGYTMLTPYIEFGLRYWDRNLGGGQVEDYQNGDALAGIMVQVSPLSGLILSAYGSAGSTLDAQARSSPDTFNLGNAGMYKFGAKVGYDVTQRIEIFTTLDYDTFRYIQSPVAADGFYEPDSHTEETTGRVGIAYHFK